MLLTALAGLAGALSAWLAFGRRAYYHDGLRPLARRSPERSQVFGLTVAPVLKFGLPLSLVTGVPLIHLLLLGTDAIGCLPLPAWAILLAGAAYGSAAFALAREAGAWLLALPGSGAALQALGMTVLLAFPLIPAAALWRHSGWKSGAPPAALCGAATLAAWFGWAPSYLHLPAVAAILGLILLIRAALRQAPMAISPPPPPGRFPPYVYAAAAVNAGLLAALAQQMALAGDPLAAAMLAGNGDKLAAAAHGAVRTLSFLPTIVATYWSGGGALATAGVPDWLFSVGYLSPGIVAALLAGTAAFALELALIPRFGREVLRRPGITAVAGHVRTAVSQATDLAFVAGAVAGGYAAAVASAAPVALWMGPLIPALAAAANEALRRPLPRAVAASIGLALFLLLQPLLA